MKLRWSREAIDALRAARAWIAAEDPAAAKRVATRLLAGADRLSAFPRLGRAGRVASTRELVVADTPFILIYRIEADTITIVAVLHHARDRE
ncbi:MAG: type II toxin-antitoxin system RelE/ParE family toxin [bacterium]|nr:type II toxin-antitoxin system RelE/ParE family toxin [Myxococcales bacterium]